MQQRPEKPTSNGKCMNNRQAMNSHESGARTRLKHHLLIPDQYKGGGPWFRGKRRYSLEVRRRGKSILRFLPKLF